MSFIYPNFLWALLIIAVPIIIHLVNLRRHKTVYFSNVNLLKLVKKETQRKSKLKQLLILASRILLLLSLVLAFARPYIPTGQTGKTKGNNAVGIYIDNSFSMNAEGEEGRAIESAKQKAFSIVNGSEPNTKFALLSNELSEQQNRFYSKNEIIQLIAELEQNAQPIKLSTVVLRLKDMMDNFLLETNKSIYLISDFQKSSFDIDALEADSVLAYNFVRVPVNEVSNLYIDSCWYDAPTHHFNQTEYLNIRITNNSQTDYPQLAINFYLNDTLRSLQSISIGANETQIVSMQYKNLSKGLQLGKVEISDYPIVYDNTMYLAYRVKNEINALLIEDKQEDSPELRALFANDDYIKLDISKSDRLQINSLDAYSTIFINELRTISSGLAAGLTSFVSNGGTLVLIPDLECNTSQFNLLLTELNSVEFASPDTLSIPVAELAFDDPIFSEVFSDNMQKVDLPTIKNRFRFDNSNQRAISSALTFADQSIALAANKFGEGKVYVFSFPVFDNQNEFKDHLLFLPTFYNAVLHSEKQNDIYYTLGADNNLEIKLDDQNLNQNLLIRNKNGDQEFVPLILNQKGKSIEISTAENFDAGFYKVFLGDDLVTSFAFNYQLQESELDFYNNEEISAVASGIGIYAKVLEEKSDQNIIEIIEELDNGKQLWKLFILLALLFILAEAAVIKFWK